MIILIPKNLCHESLNCFTASMIKIFQREREREGNRERWGPDLISSRCWLRWVGPRCWSLPKPMYNVTDKQVDHSPSFFFMVQLLAPYRERERDQWWVLMTPLRQLAPPHQLINLDRSFVFVGPFPFDGHIE